MLLALLSITGVTLALSLVLAGWSFYLRLRREYEPRRRQRLTDIWRAPLVAVLMDSAAPEHLWARVALGDELVFLDFLLQHARRVDGEDRKRIRMLASPYLGSIRPYLTARVAETRARAIQTLGELGLADWNASVVQALSDPSPLVALIAATTLAREQAHQHVDDVLDHLPRFGHWRPDYLASMLASFGPAATGSIRARFQDETLPASVRAILVDALGHLNDAMAAEAAERELARSDNGEFRAACLRLLARVGSRQHLQTVRQAMGAEDFIVRLAATRAMGHIGDAAEQDDLLDSVLADPSPWVAITAGRALMEAGGHARLRELAGSEHRRAPVARQVMAEAR